jgi:micrococcal nuclease
MFQYRATVERVVDGDTLDVLIDLGFDVHVAQRIRLWGINTPENRGPEAEMGRQCTEHVSELIQANEGKCILDTFKDAQGKYGRYLAIITLHDENGLEFELHHHLKERGWARHYLGKGEMPRFNPDVPYPLPKEMRDA